MEIRKQIRSIPIGLDFSFDPNISTNGSLQLAVHHHLPSARVVPVPDISFLHKGHYQHLKGRRNV